jgi:AcrR family transcriptional regulator
VSAETIYDRAREIIDREGSEALNVRRLAADLKISTRTLYKRIGHRENLVRHVVARHFASIRNVLKAVDSNNDWQEFAVEWCASLHEALMVRPRVTALMADSDRDGLRDGTGALVEAAVQAGIPRELARQRCNALVDLTIGQALVDERTQRTSQSSASAGVVTMLEWVLAGVRLAHGSATMSSTQ